MFTILSIDWDYFVEADANYRAIHFPDIPNEKYAMSLQDAIWVSRYAADDSLAEVGYNKWVFDIVKHVERTPHVVVADSHRWLVPYAIQFLQEENEKTIELLNIDFHSDVRDDTQTLDCGNWLSILMEQYHGDYSWLGWKDSFRKGVPKRLQFMTDPWQAIRKIKKVSWDMVFICKSGMWSPPHLDTAFEEVFRPLTEDTFSRVDVQTDIWTNRYERLLPSIKSMRESLANFMGTNNGRKS